VVKQLESNRPQPGDKPAGAAADYQYLRALCGSQKRPVGLVRFDNLRDVDVRV